MSKKCAKCNGENIAIEWHRDRFDCSFKDRHHKKIYSDDEHLHHYCRTCGFSWTCDPEDKEAL